MEEPFLGADNLGRVSSSSRSGQVSAGCTRDLWVGEHVLQPPELEVEQGKGDGNWVTGGSIHWEGGIGNIPAALGEEPCFQSLGTTSRLQISPSSPRAATRIFPAPAGSWHWWPWSLGCCGSAGVSWTHWLPAGRGTGVWFWLTRITWTLSTRQELLPAASFGQDLSAQSLRCSPSPSAALSFLPG